MGNVKDRFCANCGKKLERRRSEKPDAWDTRKFCSRECVTHHLPAAMRHQVTNPRRIKVENSGKSHQHETNSHESHKARVTLAKVTFIDANPSRLWTMRKLKMPA